MKKTVLGFSLVEVTIALGIVAFCVVSVFGLLPVALRSVKEAGDRRSAVEMLNLVSGDLLSRAASSTNPNHLSGRFTNLRVDVPATQVYEITEDGQQSGDLRYKLRISITPPSYTNAGVAKLAVAWPLAANYVGSSNPTEWTNAQGVVKTVVFFNK